VFVLGKHFDDVVVLESQNLHFIEYGMIEVFLNAKLMDPCSSSEAMTSYTIETVSSSGVFTEHSL
jgi:hypothetical protein